jgi:hypothetical protein
MRKLIIICAALLLASPAWGVLYTGNSDYTNPYADDAYTMALWHFDETTGTDTPIVDSSTWDDTGHDMGIVKGLGLELDPNKLWSSSMTGFGNAADAWYNSASDSNTGPISSPDAQGSLGTSTYDGYTFEFWMHPYNAGGGWGSRILKKSTGGAFNIGYQNSLVSMGWYAPGGWYSVGDNTTITHNDWTHVMITCDETQDTDTAVISFYHNGVLTYSETTDDGKTFGNWDRNSVKMFNDDSGTLYVARQYMGMLDEVRISNCLRIPEPTTLSLLAIAALAFFRRKK